MLLEEVIRYMYVNTRCCFCIQMGRKWISTLWNFVIVVCIIFVVDYIGLFVHFFEWEYTRYYPLPKLARYSNTTAALNNYYTYGFLHKSALDRYSSSHLTVLVKSALQNEQRRSIIRRTWGFEKRFSDVNYRCVFLLGSSDDDTIMAAVSKEATTYKDIVQGDFTDSYFNNTIKTMLGIRWATQYWKKSDYYMFVDDDYYVSIKNILKFIAYPELYPNTINGLWSKRNLEETLLFTSNERLFAGYVMQTAPLRHKFSKWYVSLTEYPFDLWPPYVTAGAFVLSNDALQNLYFFGKHTHTFRFDDIFLAMVALNANLTLTHCDRFHFKPLPYDGAKSYQHVLASHGFEDSEYMEKVWTECRSAGYA